MGHGFVGVLVRMPGATTERPGEAQEDRQQTPKKAKQPDVGAQQSTGSGPSIPVPSPAKKPRFMPLTRSPGKSQKPSALERAKDAARKSKEIASKVGRKTGIGRPDFMVGFV